MNGKRRMRLKKSRRWPKPLIKQQLTYVEIVVKYILSGVSRQKNTMLGFRKLLPIPLFMFDEEIFPLKRSTKCCMVLEMKM